MPSRKKHVGTINEPTEQFTVRNTAQGIRTANISLQASPKSRIG